MDNNERRLVGLAVVFLAGFVALLVSQTIVDAALGSPRFAVAQGYVQLLSGPATAAAVITFLWHRWAQRCGVHHCIRLGQHPVKGTIYRVCHRHHQAKHHRDVYAMHILRHGAEALGWGDSHEEEVT